MTKRIPKLSAPEEVHQKLKSELLTDFCEVYIPMAPDVYTYGVPAGVSLCRGDVVWVQFANNEEYLANEAKLFEVSADSDGSDDLIVFLKDTKAFKVLPPNRKVSADAVLKAKLEEAFGQGNVKYVGKSIENGGKMN